MAARQALDQLGELEAALVIVYASVRYDLKALLHGIRAVTGDTPLIGATSSGHFHQGILTPVGRGVAVLILRTGLYRFGVSSVVGLRENAFGAGRKLAETSRRAARDHGEPRGHAALLLLTDGLAGHQQTVLNGIYRETGATIPVVGGAAGDDHRLEQTFVFHDDEVLADAAVGVWIDAEQPIGVYAQHGWHPVGLPMLVTKVDGPVVHEIGGRPATEVFQERFRYGGLAEGELPRGGPGERWNHAFGLIEPDGTHLVRSAFVDDEGALHTYTPLPAHGAVQIMSCQRDDVVEVAEPIVREALAGHHSKPSVVLVFSCVARLDILDDRDGEEAARLQSAAGDVPTFGFYTYGEFARTRSVAGFHQATLTAVAL